MIQDFDAQNRLDEQGRPAGGFVVMSVTPKPGDDPIALSIRWQDGPLGAPDDPSRLEPNGCFVETVINAAIQRIDHYQETEFASEYNADALFHLEAALASLQARTADRTKRNVEGTHEQ